MKEWTTPELIVLGRGAPEENVLCYCKTRPQSCQANACSRKEHRLIVPTWRYHHS
jgi:hypothetical protein